MFHSLLQHISSIISIKLPLMGKSHTQATLSLLLLALCASQTQAFPFWVKIKQPHTFWDYFQVSEGGSYSYRETDNGKTKEFILSQRTSIYQVKYILHCHQNELACENVSINPSAQKNLELEPSIQSLAQIQLWNGGINPKLSVSQQDAKVDRVILYTENDSYKVCIFLGDFLLTCLTYFLLRHTRKTKRQQLWLQFSTLAISLLCEQISYLQEALENSEQTGWRIIISVPLIATFYQIFSQVLKKIFQYDLRFIARIIFNALAAFYLIQTYAFPLLTHFTLSFFLTHSLSSLQIFSFTLSFRLLLSKQIYILPITIPQNLIWMNCLLLSQSSLCIIISHRKRLQEKKRQRNLLFTIHEGDDSCVKVNEEIQYCSICLDSITNNFALTPCSHKFHLSCLNQWLAKSETCPIDRKPVLASLR